MRRNTWDVTHRGQGHKNIFESDAKPLYNGPQSLKWVKTRKAEAITQKELLLLLLAWLWTFEEMLERSWCWGRQVVTGPRSGESPGWDYYIRHYIRKPRPIRDHSEQSAGGQAVGDRVSASLWVIRETINWFIQIYKIDSFDILNVWCKDDCLTI